MDGGGERCKDGERKVNGERQREKAEKVRQLEHSVLSRDINSQRH